VPSDLSFRIRDSRAGDRDRLRDIMVAAKAHWGYEIAWVDRWAETGFIVPATPDSEVLVAEVDQTVVGWSQLVPRDDVGWLEDLWIDPSRIGTGVGGALFGRSAARARALNLKRLEWEAEPRAVGFYRRMGGRYVRSSGTIELGRVLPIMALDL
jgi:GNAT superfamily N-acetyltransferase